VGRPIVSAALSGRNAVVTGASQGLGRAIAEAYVGAGASVFICARDAALLNTVQRELAARAGAGQRVEAIAADVSRSGDVERLAAAALKAFPQLHVLVNNAGVYGPMGPIEDVDWAEWVRAIEINLMGSVLCCRALMAHFKARRYGKIVQLSGGGATQPMANVTAYAASKAAIVRFAESLADEGRAFGVDVNSIAPGALNTRLLDQMLAADPARVGEGFYKKMAALKESGGTPLERGAALAVYLGSAESDGITGRLLSAVWDPWESLAGHREDLGKTDVYTLRRIVPKDRGLPWGDR
jgi:NAD(P)-dependent dehydrogenase (short-subunit alcohol dehydrogenase family)